MEPVFVVPPMPTFSPTGVPYLRSGRKMTMIKAAGSAPSFQKKNGRLASPDAVTTHPASIGPGVIVTRKGDEEASDSEYCTVWRPQPNLRTAKRRPTRAPSSLSSKIKSPVERIARVPCPQDRQSFSQTVSQSVITARPPSPSSSPQEQQAGEPFLVSYFVWTTDSRQARQASGLCVDRVAAKHGDYSCTPFSNPNRAYATGWLPSSTLLVETTLLFVNQHLALAPHRVFRALSPTLRNGNAAELHERSVVDPVFIFCPLANCGAERENHTPGRPRQNKRRQACPWEELVLNGGCRRTVGSRWS